MIVYASLQAAERLSLAARVAERLCALADVDLIQPDSLLRLAVVDAVALGHTVEGTGVTRERIRRDVTITLPGLPDGVVGLLEEIPVVGLRLAEICREREHTTIYLADAALRDGETLLSIVWHELGHAGTIKAGGLPWCLAYLIAAEARAAGEAPCYGAGLAVLHVLGGDVDAGAAQAKEALLGYGLDDASLSMARAMIDSAAASVRAGDFGGVEREVVAALAVEGVSP